MINLQLSRDSDSHWLQYLVWLALNVTMLQCNIEAGSMIIIHKLQNYFNHIWYVSTHIQQRDRVHPNLQSTQNTLNDSYKLIDISNNSCQHFSSLSDGYQRFVTESSSLNDGCFSLFFRWISETLDWKFH